jgi:hypothetical protein
MSSIMPDIIHALGLCTYGCAGEPHKFDPKLQDDKKLIAVQKIIDKEIEENIFKCLINELGNRRDDLSRRIQYFRDKLKELELKND